ncbi:MAG TPA: SDR family NAD(P)-dependent oxidoreductase, partial [Gemmatimonadota bacterium]|nr:SDR family NAD(P)-dependent oxidoreductase [Gemmatimonadota bacterium]
MGELDGKICLVAGASRGVGRGIAEGLGEAGATVYVTGRTTRRRGRLRGRRRAAHEGRPETIEETAERVTELGGEGIAVACDHTVETEVVALLKRIEREQGRLDVLANNVWGGYERHDEAAWEAPFWEIPIERWDLMMRTGLEGKWRTARLAAPLLLRSRSGLLVNVSSPVGTPYRSHLPYYVVNHAVDRMTEAMAGDFRRHGVVVVSLQPGFTRTERVEEVYAADPVARKKDRVDETSHSPRYVGRAVAALAAAPPMERSGQVWAVGVLAREYGFTDVDGRRPMWPPAEAEAAGRRKPEGKGRGR